MIAKIRALHPFTFGLVESNFRILNAQKKEKLLTYCEELCVVWNKSNIVHREKKTLLFTSIDRSIYQSVLKQRT